MSQPALRPPSPAVSVRPTPASRPPAALDRLALTALHRALRGSGVRLMLWDGTSLDGDAAATAGTIVLKDRATLWRVLLDPDMQFGEACMDGRIETRGDLVALLEAIYRTRAARPLQAWRRPRRSAHTLRAARQNVHRHYDLGNDFYRLWLDDQLLYTCAYFPTRDASLEAAQVAKMDRVCRKLALRPGEVVFEAGCGWGALARHMAREYGVRVRAWNVSREQIAFARARAWAEGLAGRVEFVEDDYRRIDGRCDAFVSVGMLEHVGLEHYRDFGHTIARTLDPARGRGLLHFIGRTRGMPLNPWIRRRIFPGAHPPTLSEACAGALEPFDLAILDVENLRAHYALTLHHWLLRFEASQDRVRDMFDERFVRAWRLYLAGSQAAFQAGSMQLFQVVFARSRATAATAPRDEERQPCGPATS